MTSSSVHGAQRDYHLTWHTYGTWLPGDGRGWHRRGDGARHRPPSPGLARWCREQMRRGPVWLNRAQRALVEHAIRETCRHRAWPLLEVCVLAWHVHVVVSAPVSAEVAMAQLKSWATRALRSAGSIEPDRPVWAVHGSTRTLFTPEYLQRVLDYLRDGHHDEPARSRTARP